MRLPHRDPIQLGPTPYEVFQEKEGIPSVRGFFIEDLMDVEVKPWARMGALGSYLNMGEQQEHDAYICEIPAGKQTEPQHHMFETLVYIHKGRGATTVWFEGDAKQTFEWAAGAHLRNSAKRVLSTLQRFATSRCAFSPAPTRRT